MSVRTVLQTCDTGGCVVAWVRLDDAFPFHPKVLPLSSDAGWLHVCALCWCNQQLTDGHVSDAALPRLTAIKQPAKAAAELVESGLWEASPNGYQIHDYLHFQASKADVLAGREAETERKRKYRESKAQK